MKCTGDNNQPIHYIWYSACEDIICVQQNKWHVKIQNMTCLNTVYVAWEHDCRVSLYIFKCYSCGWKWQHKKSSFTTVSPWCKQTMAIFQCYSGFCVYCSSRWKYRFLWVSTMMVMFEIKEVRALLCVENWGRTFFQGSSTYQSILVKHFCPNIVPESAAYSCSCWKSAKHSHLLVNIYQWKLFLRKFLYQFCFQKPFPNGNTQAHKIRSGHSTFWCGIFTY